MCQITRRAGVRHQARRAVGTARIARAVTFYLQTLGSRRRRVNEGEWVAEILRGFADRRLESWEVPLPGERVRRILNRGADHINALVDAGELRVMAGTEQRWAGMDSDKSCARAEGFSETEAGMNVEQRAF